MMTDEEVDAFFEENDKWLEKMKEKLDSLPYLSKEERDNLTNRLTELEKKQLKEV